MSVSHSQAITTVPWRVRDAWIVFILPWVLLPVVVVLLLQALSGLIPQLQPFMNSLASNDRSAAFGIVAIDAIGSFIVIGYFLRKYKVGLKSLGVRSFSVLKVIGYALLIMFSLGLLVTAAYYLVTIISPGFNPDEAQTNEFTGNPSLISLFALVILPPLVEEPIFRGFIFPAFAKRYGLIVGAIFASVIFGFAHLQANVGIYTFILGLLLCWLYVRTGSIIPGVAVHMANNYLAYIAQMQS